MLQNEWFLCSSYNTSSDVKRILSNKNFKHNLIFFRYIKYFILFK